EGHAEKCVGGTLIELAMKHTLFFDFELKQRVTGRQIDVIAFARIPAADDQTARVGICFDLLNQSCNLIDAVAFRTATAERTPEVAVNWTKISGLATKAPSMFFISPFFPDVHAFCAQVRFVRVAGEKPKQL